MNLKYTIFFLFFLKLQFSYAQNEIANRIILIGDAGEINATQKLVIENAVKNAIPNKTIVIFLGDNIYPKGMGLAGKEKIKAEEVLKSQYKAFREKNIPVYFIPGNHDWDKSGTKGYEKIIAANNFIESQKDSLLQVIPKDGCAGPYEVNLTDSVVLVAIDTEWWLFPFEKQTESSDCECKTKRAILGKLDDIVKRNYSKVIIFATHHPFVSNSHHSGYYTAKEHLFPLTQANKKLYIPLPVVGSLYPLLRKTFPPAEDHGNILYKEMKSAITDILKQHPNVIQVSGHEHTLELTTGDVLQVVSGAGSKHTAVRKNTKSEYASGNSGYVAADILNDKSIQLNYFEYNDQVLKKTFSYVKPFENVTSNSFTSQKIWDDSVSVSLLPDLDIVTKSHRKWFGENYRKIWAMQTTLPVLKLSTTTLTPTEAGGGMQTRSLRLVDSNKKEWVLRSIEKYPDALLPQALNQTFASKLLRDNVSANFPFAPLVVPPIANALGVPHSNPKIAYLSADEKFGVFNKDFANTIALLEEREPLGKSISTAKMQLKLKEDNDNKIDQKAFLTARIQDFFLGDWDRHGDQWRWVDTSKRKGKMYIAVPRDRDQVFYINQGIFPSILALPWLMPKFQGFGTKIKNIHTFAFNARLIDGIFTNGLNHNDWATTTANVVNKLTDSVIDAALSNMPPNIYKATHKELRQILIMRKLDLVRSLPIYYKFLNKIIDIIISDKNEVVKISDTLNGKLNITIYKIDKNGEVTNTTYSRVVEPSITKEIRLYLNAGEDKIFIKNYSSPIKIRIIENAISKKYYTIEGSKKYLRKIHLYSSDLTTFQNVTSSYIHKHLQSENIGVEITNRYNKRIPLLNAGFNIDDGILLGGGFKWVNQGFRKSPFASQQQFLFTHSLATNAYRLSYKSEWRQVFKNTDVVIVGNILAPKNTQNFFGKGNETEFDKTDGFRKFYRARFSIYELNTGLRFKAGKQGSFITGIFMQHYNYNPNDNIGRFTSNSSAIGSYDSTTLSNKKSHIGLTTTFIHDSRNNILIPKYGTYLKLHGQANKGVNSFSKSFFQFTGELAFYKPLDRKGNITIANRIGGGITKGSATFYQSLFLGGHSNLLGYRQFRFAGDNMIYNNLEARIKVANVTSYIVPGELGLIGTYDIGKVWQQEVRNNKWHNSFGVGVYFAPSQIFLLQVVAAKSEEEWLPYVKLGFRF
jgi:hypothetical protein